MLTKAQVQRYAFDSGLRDLMIAEKEVVGPCVAATSLR